MALSKLRPYGSGFLIFSDYGRGADPAVARSWRCRSSTSSPTTRSAWARTGRPTSRSSSSRRCARCPALIDDPPRRRQRGRRGVAADHGAHSTTRSCWCCRARRCRRSTAAEYAPAAGVRAGRVRARRPAGRRSRGDPHRHRHRGAAGGRRVRAAEREGVERARGQHAVVGAVRAPGRGVPRRPCCRRRSPRGSRVEQASDFGWERYVGPTGDDDRDATFGASAPLKDLQQRFGFTPEAVADAARAQLNDG